MSHSRCRFACLLFGLLACAAFNSAAAVVLPWYNGPFEFQIGTDTPCGGSGSEPRVNGYAGQSLLPPNRTPAVGEVFYTHLVLGHPGNPCFGSAVGIELLLPAGVSTAISAADPVFCFARLPANGQHADLLDNLAGDPGYGCPQALSQGIQGLAIYAPNGGAGGGSWGMAVGFYLEFLVPLRATTSQNGSNSIYFRVNPDIGVGGYPGVPAQVNSDVIFRSPMENQDLTLDICTVTPIAQGC